MLHLLYTAGGHTSAGWVPTALLVFRNIQIVGLELLLREGEGLSVEEVIHRASIRVRNRVFVVTGDICFFLLHVHLHLLQSIGILVCGDLEAELDGLLGDERAPQYLAA